MLVVDNLTIKYKNHIVLNELSLNIKTPGIYALCAPNGYGKTTLLRAIGGMDLRAYKNIYLIPNAHSAKRIYPSNKIEYHKQLFYFESEGMLFPNLTVIDHLKFISDIFETKDNYVKITNALDMNYFLHKRIKELSLGMRQQLIIAMAISSNAKYIILDEPNNGLDILRGSLVNTLIKSYTQKDKLVFYSSHNLNQVADNAHQIFFLQEGKIQKYEKPARNLKNEFLNTYSLIKSD